MGVSIGSLITLAQAAENCHLPESFLLKWTESGYAPHYFVGDYGPLFKKTEIKQWIEANLLRVFPGMPVPKRLDVLTPIERQPDGTDSVPVALSGMEKLLRVGITATCPGIYFLCAGGDVVYVGQAISVLGRVCTHISEGVKQFDLNRVFFLPCPREDLNVVERHWIQTLRPKYNRSGLPRSHALECEASKAIQ